MKNGNDIKIMHSDRTGKITSKDNDSTKDSSKVENSRSKSTSQASEKGIK